jgi:ABC-type antimicrobial peptide transport system permease subunit
MYEETRGIANIFGFTALMALLISCMGLFGLVSQNIASRMKEISIRKVLGASIPSIAGLVNRRFLMLLLLAAVIATPLSYKLIVAVLDSIYSYHIGVRPLAIVLAHVLVFFTAAVTIATQVRRLSAANPATVLRNE